MIRKFEEYDIDEIMRIWQNENMKAHKFIPEEYWQINYNYVKEIIPNTEIYVYVLEQQIIGFIGINDNYIEGIFIDSKHQHNGIGRALLNKVKEKRNNLKLKVYQRNTNAMNFYKNNGFIKKEENIDTDTKELEYIMIWNKK